jgi:hypothetical protein
MIFLLQSAQPFPYSALLLCYLPLAAIVFGLLAFFALTDWHARRPYLRFNPFVAASASPEELRQRAPASGETPAGTIGGGAAAGAPTTYVGAQQDIIPTAETDPPAEPGDALNSEERIGRLPAVPKPDSPLTDALNEPAGTEDDDPNRYV